MSEPSILVVDDKVDLAEAVALVASELSSDVAIAHSAEEALDVLRRGPVDLILSDIKMPGLDGVGLLREVQKVWPHCRTILLTAYGTIESAVEATKLGAFDYLTKPFDSAQLLAVARRALDDLRAHDGVARLREDLDETACFEGIHGRSRRMLRLFETIRRVAPSEASVMVCGESGTGKELVARAIHALSPRGAGPMIAFNAGAMPEHLAEAELFGARRGSYTGASRDHDGLFLEARGGTLFIDELGSMPLALQGKLLRVLQEREVMRVGDNRPVPVDVRVLCALNEDPLRLVATGALRKDLYYRLAVVRITVPALRERAEDIPLIAQRFLDTHGGPRLSPAALQVLVGHDWPGNVRELQNVIHRAALLSSGPEITPTDLVFERDLVDVDGVDDELRYEDAKQRVVEQFQRRYVAGLLERCGGNVSSAARTAGITRAALYRLMKRLHLEGAATTES